MPVKPLHLSRTHYPPHQHAAMEIRDSLIIVMIVGSLLALTDISSCLPASKHPPEGRATSLTTPAPTMTAIRRYMAAPKLRSTTHQDDLEEVLTCKIILWKLFCKVRFVPATTSRPTTAETRVPRATTINKKKFTAPRANNFFLTLT